MKTDYTPGPWKNDEASGTQTVWGQGTEALNRKICVIPPVSENGYQSKTDEANARLIAAAPELLTALQDLLFHVELHKKQFSSPNKWTKNAHDAIRKAKGEEV